MKIWMIVAVCAFVFLVCFLLDTLFKHLFPKSKLEKSKQAVRPARRSATFGVILLFVPVVVLLFFMPKGGDTLLLIGCIALRFPGEELAFDPKQMKFTNKPEANAFLKAPKRKDWDFAKLTAL